MSRLTIGMIGCGVVGSSVLKALHNNAALIAVRAGKEIMIKRVVVRDEAKARARLKALGIESIALGTELDSVFEDEDIDVVVELMGGVELAYEVAKRALKAKKAFITANKALLAYHRYELAALAQGVPLGFEASVCGGIPIIRALKDGLSANHILAIRGILNGTSNYILTQMQAHNQSFETALAEAQRLGYAEADPSLDISGGDAGHKLLILASLAYGIRAKPEEILIEGIEGIEPDDMEFAKEFGYVIKLLGIAKKRGENLELRVHPSMVAKEAMISNVSGVMNGISVVGDYVGESMYYGAGAGGDATASSVVSDLIAIARGENLTPHSFPMESSATLLAKDKIYTRYYIRLYADDKPGVLGQVTQILGRHNISISAFLQKEAQHSNTAAMLLSTHHCFECEIQNALREVENLACIRHKPFMIRLEDEA